MDQNEVVLAVAALAFHAGVIFMLVKFWSKRRR